MESLDRALLWPLSNWLWATIVDPLIAGLTRLTPRRLVYLLAFIAFAWAAAELLFPADVALMLAGDGALYVEAITFTYIAVAQARLHRAIAPALRMAGTALRRTVVRGVARTRRLPRRPRLFDKDDSDVPDGTFAFA
jgi:hypothetical protein